MTFARSLHWAASRKRDARRANDDLSGSKKKKVFHNWE